MKQMDKATHIIEFKKDGNAWNKQPAIGKTDLFNILRDMMKNGYTEFKITVLSVPETITANQFS
jgi:hypothetical protein